MRGGSERFRLLVAAHALRVRGVGDRYGFGVLVLGVVLLCVDLLMLLEVLRSLERLLANIADMWLEWCVN